MPSLPDFKVSPSVQPKPEDYGYDLDKAFASVMGLHAVIPNDAFTAETLGTERAGNGVLIRENGVVLTIGYLITEAETIWLHLNDGRVVPGHVLGYDQATGFGLVQALAKLDLPALPLGNSTMIPLDEKVVVAGAGGRQRSVAARVVGKQEFAGYWEYVLDEAIFTAPAHPNWGGTALIGPAGDLLGIGSLQLERARERGPNEHLNMIVPIDDLKPILDDLLEIRPAEPSAAALARPLRHRGRGQDRGGRPREPRTGAEGRHPHRRHHPGGRGPRGERACHHVPQGVVARQCGRRRAAAGLSRRAHIRDDHPVR